MPPPCLHWVLSACSTTELPEFFPELGVVEPVDVRISDMVKQVEAEAEEIDVKAVPCNVNPSRKAVDLGD